MQNNRLTLVVLAILAVVLGFWLKSYLSPENVVRRTLLAAVETFEREQLLGTVRVISRSYRDLWGQSYESVAGNISEIMSTFDDLSVDLEVQAIDAFDGAIRVRIKFVITGRDSGGSGNVLGSLTDPCSATILWRKEPQGWRLVTTEALDIPELRDELDGMRSS